MNKNLLIAFAMTIIFVILLSGFIYITLSNKSNNNTTPITNQQNIPKPTPKDPENGTGAYEGDQVTQSTESRGYYLGELAQKLPHKGTNFSLSYNYNNDSFTLYLKPGNEAAGRSEFANYLKQNNIQSPNWIENLKTTTSPI